MYKLNCSKYSETAVVSSVDLVLFWEVVVTSTKEFVFTCLLVGVQQDSRKTTDQISAKLGWRTDPVNFWCWSRERDRHGTLFYNFFTFSFICQGIMPRKTTRRIQVADITWYLLNLVSFKMLKMRLRNNLTLHFCFLFQVFLLSDFVAPKWLKMTLIDYFFISHQF